MATAKIIKTTKTTLKSPPRTTNSSEPGAPKKPNVATTSTTYQSGENFRQPNFEGNPENQGNQANPNGPGT
jgi:hypothetical protein